ncbi:MFS general substrate transporter [Neoconidiobolus thromboides FSU 785]|nr:MFS general substrate transporter [Neoconidiobolus thromboides FSU 785]
MVLNNDNLVSVEDKKEMNNSKYSLVIVACSFLMQACTFGTTISYGVFIDYYSKVVFPDSEYSIISLIGIIAPALIAFTSPLAGKLANKIGLKKGILIGTTFITLSYLLASFSFKVWHLLLTQGIMFGIGGGLVFVPANVIVSQWFTKNRGLALGIGTAGSGIGGMAFSVLNGYLLPQVGFEWTLRYNCIILFSCLIVSILLLKERKPDSDNTANNNKINIVAKPESKRRMLLSGKFLLFSLSNSLFVSAHFISLYYLPPYAISINLTNEQGAALVAILSASNAVGRIIFGFIGDKFGHLNIYIISLALTSILMILWRFSFNYVALIFFSILYGLPSGGLATLFPSSCAEVFGLENMAVVMGYAYAPAGLAELVGPPIAGLIYDYTLDYSNLTYYAMAIFLVSTFSSYAVKTFYLKKSTIDSIA